MKLLITGAWDCTEEQRNMLRRMGHEVFFMQYEKDALPCLPQEIDGVICNALFLYHDITAFCKLKFIQLTSAGLDRVPLDYIKSHGIALYNARGVYSVPMAEFAVSGVLWLYKKSKFFYENQKIRKWEKQRDLIELSGKTVLIVGCGSVGIECAKRFKAFGCDVCGVDLYPYKNEFFTEIAGLNGLDDKLPIADVVVLTLPLTNETKGLFNADRFGKMKNGAVLINISRGAIVDENALIYALDTKLYGAILDVFTEEPLKDDSALWEKENVIITPHNGFVGENNNDRLNKTIIGNLKEYYEKD